MNADDRPPPPPDRNLLGRWTPWIVVVVLAAVAGALLTASSESRRDREPAGLDPAFVYDVERYKRIPPEKIGYREVARIETRLAKATALAVGPRDEIVVGGDDRVLVFGPGGERLAAASVGDTPLGLACPPGGGLLVGFRRAVVEGPLTGPFARLLEIPGDRARITSIAVDRSNVFVADWGSRAVWRFTRDGRRLGRIGDRDSARNVPGFVVPSPYFDVRIAPDGLLRVVDPGRHRVTAFTTGGDLEVSWGEASYALEGFSGCCNPSHIALLPDGGYVTSEKGIARVKVYDFQGRFVTAVVGPDGLDTETGPCEVEVDRNGRVVVLDPGRGRVRVFVQREGIAYGD